MAINLRSSLCPHTIMALTFLLWNARSLLRKSQEFKTYLDDNLPSVVAVCETWLHPHLQFSLPGYTIARKDRDQGRGGGVLLAIRNTLTHTHFTPPSHGGRLEVTAARIALRRGWLTVAVCYNPGGATSPQELQHYITHLPPPVLIMGNFNAHHQCWDPHLPFHHRNAMGNVLYRTLLDSSHLSLLSPPGLLTRFDPHTGAASVLDLFLGDASLSSMEFKEGPYMGSDHIPIVATIQTITPQPSPGCLPRWNLRSSNWCRYSEALNAHPPIPDLPLGEAVQSFGQALLRAGRASFNLTTHRSPRRPGKPWWDDSCAQAVRARRQAWNQWRKTPTLQAGRHYRQLDAICAKTILRAKRRAWDSHTSSLSFSSSTKRTWDFIHCMEGKKNTPLHSTGSQLPDSARRSTKS